MRSANAKRTGNARDAAKPGFFEQVHAIVARIPPGKVMTYGQIADVLHNVCSARYVGYAMHSSPVGENLPCHRVVNRNGDLSPGGHFGGPENHRRILEEEGVTFTPQGRIDLAACRFDPYAAPVD
ncbi:MAG: MGMT family protein [Deltaproteobacteria bacterium]|nr:MGMT family protein [Deltaproteobacteria bacterium]